MTEEKVLKAIKECRYISEMDNTPEVAFHKTEDGDTRFLDNGSFVIYDIKTNLKAKNIKKVAAKDPYRGAPYILIKLHDGNELMLTSQPDSRFYEADIESFKDELINKYGGVPLLHEGNMEEDEILEQIEDCSCMTEMDDMPYVAFSQYEDGDTYFDEDGYFVIYDVTTCLRAEDFLAIRWKDNDELTRDPYVAFYLSGDRYLELCCIPGNMREADVERFKKKLIEHDLIIDSVSYEERERRERLEGIVRQVIEELGYDEEEDDEDAAIDDFEIDEDGELLSYSGCEEHVTIPEGVTWIGEFAFSGADVKSVTIPEGVYGIGIHAFTECTELTTVILPDSLKYIQNCAFNECKSLSSITIPDSVEEINNGAFAKCDALADEDGWIIFRDICFDNVSGASDLTIPDNIRIISGGTCEDSPVLKTLYIPDNVAEVRCWSFARCKNLESVIFLNDAVEIENGVFSDCDQDKLVIYARPGSTAEQYALEKGMRFAPIFGHTKEKAHGKIIDFQSYVNKRDLDAGKITLDELSLEELESVEELYTKEINQIIREIESLQAENERLRKLLGK